MDEIFDFITASVTDGCFVLDNDFKIIFFNRAAEEITGWKREHVIGKRCFDIFQGLTGNGLNLCHEGKCPSFDSIKTGCLNNASYDLQVPLRDNITKTLQLHSRTFRDKGSDELFSVVVFQDISKSREFDILRQDFMDSMSHELRTPISTIKAYTATLKHPKAHFDKETMDSFLTIIDAEASKLSKIVDEVLETARISQNRLALNASVIKVCGLIDESVRKIPISDKHSLTVLCDSDCKIFGDREQIGYVLEHLVSNAVKFSPEGGDITLRVEEDQRDVVVISVEDNGIGIPFDQQKKVFENFFRIDVGTTKKIYSVGMGLFIVKKIVEAHCGIIWVESVPGKGSKFMFTMPRAHDTPSV